MSEPIDYGRPWWEVMNELHAENNRLKADVNELADGLKLASEVGIKMADEVTRLKAEVERLTKAGDKAFSLWSSGDETDANNFKEAIWVWTVAKKGGQP